MRSPLTAARLHLLMPTLALGLSACRACPASTGTPPPPVAAPGMPRPGGGPSSAIRDATPAPAAGAPQPPPSIRPPTAPVAPARLPVRDAWLACARNEDCVAVPADCCGCTGGGTAVAIHGTFSPAAQHVRATSCAGVSCAAVMGTDASCSSVAACVSGRCALQPAPAPSASGVGVERINPPR